jgi:hypothetical protein
MRKYFKEFDFLVPQNIFKYSENYIIKVTYDL